MVTLAQAMTWPNKAAIDAIQLKLTAVYEYRTGVGKYQNTLQHAQGEDIAGNKVRLSIWGHSDISMYKGRDLVISSGAKGGVEVSKGEYQGKETFEISVSKTGQFQLLEVHKAQQGASTPVPATTPAPASHPVANAPKTEGNGLYVVNGAKVGMALNQAITLLKEHFDPQDPEFYKEVTYHASRIIEVSCWLEAGHTLPKRTDPHQPAPAPAAEPVKTPEAEDAPY